MSEQKHEIAFKTFRAEGLDEANEKAQEFINHTLKCDMERVLSITASDRHSPGSLREHSFCVIIWYRCDK